MCGIFCGYFVRSEIITFSWSNFRSILKVIVCDQDGIPERSGAYLSFQEVVNIYIEDALSRFIQMMAPAPVEWSYFRVRIRCTSELAPGAFS